MRAILIDPVERTITEVEHDGNYKSIYPQLGCDLFTCVYLENDDAIFVDDEGLLKGGQHFFKVNTYPQPLAGRGLILGCDADGETVGATISLAEITERITFLGDLAGAQTYILDL
jgi:Domain of unknown function (DUF3846)